MKNNLLVSNIKELILQDLDKTTIYDIVKAWLPGISKKDFNECFSEAFTSL